MNKNNLDVILHQYIRDFELLNKSAGDGGHDEGFKWRVETAFKKAWNIEADDFAGMFSSAMAEIAKTNLVNNSTIQPISGITEIMKHEGGVEFVRNEFKMLFSDDHGDLDARGERVNSFMDSVNGRLEELFPDRWKYKQPRNAVIYYLNLWKPEDNYLYKATQANSWADYLDFGPDIGSGKSFSLKKYYAMCDELLIALNEFPEVLELHSKRFSEMAEGFDDEKHMLVFDIIFCSYYMGYYRECPAIEKRSTKAKAQAAKIAAINERIETLEGERSAKAEELEAIKASITDLPDLTGIKVNHKKFGEGIIIANNAKRIEVEFKDRKMDFVAKSFKTGLISLEKESLQALMLETASLEDDIIRLQGDLSRLTNELNNLQ